MPETSVELDVKNRWSEDGIAEGYLLIGGGSNKFFRLHQAFFDSPGVEGDEPVLPIVINEYAMEQYAGVLAGYMKNWAGLVSGGAARQPHRKLPTHFDIVRRDLARENPSFVG